MKAVICDKYGPPGLLQLREVDKPVPNDNEVLIKVHAATVNRTDCAAIRAIPFFTRIVTGLFKPKKKITGTEFAGEIEALGSNVTLFRIGDRVYGFNETGSGSHAEYMTISEVGALTTIDGEMTYEQAAASTEGAYYAYNFVNKVNLKTGQKVLVNGAAGAIGSAAVQLLKHFGASITAVCRLENFELVRSLGADELIDYTREDFTEGDQVYSFIFDTVGKSSFFKCRHLLEPGGVYISSELGCMAQNLFLTLTTPIFGGKKVRFPLPTDCRGTVHFVKKLIEEREFKAVIDGVYPLEQIIEAFEYVETGQKTGNVVISMENCI